MLERSIPDAAHRALALAVGPDLRPLVAHGAKLARPGARAGHVGTSAASGIMDA